MMKAEIIKILTDAHFNKGFVEYIKNKFPEDYTPLVEQPYRYDFPENPLVDMLVRERLFLLVYDSIT